MFASNSEQYESPRESNSATASPSYLEYLDSLYSSHRLKLALGAAFFLPLKLAIAFIFLVPLLLLGIIFARRTCRTVLKRGASIIAPFILFVLVAGISAIFSVDPLRSFDKLTGLIFFSITILVFRDLVAEFGFLKILIALVSGQSIAALHSVLQGAFGDRIPRIFLGAVTESGQLAMSVIVACGLVLYLETKLESDNQSPDRLNSAGFIGVISFAALTFLSFCPIDKTSPATLCLALAASCISLFLAAWVVFRSPPGTKQRSLRAIKGLVIPLLLAALLVNLKRGPWLGVLVGGTVFLLLYHRRLVLPLLLVTCTLLLAVKPIQNRLAQSGEHFFIVGGRNEIWDIGVDLATRYPLGVGFRNSAFLQKFSDDIPKDLKHFHNNFLNVLVETGWLGLAIYLWWICSLILGGLRAKVKKPEAVLANTISCAIISWQTAGIVEYNFGDSEVVLIAFILIGILASILSSSESPSDSAVKLA